MPVSKRRHVLATLRQHLFLTQRELADLVGASVELVKSVELGRAPLSSSLAQRTSSATGVRLDWLLRNDENAPLSSPYTADYNAEFFQRWRARRSLPLEADLQGYVPTYFLGNYVALRGVAEAAVSQGEHSIELLMYQFEEFILHTRRKYGTSPGFEVEGNATITPEQLEVVSKDLSTAQDHVKKEARIFGHAAKSTRTCV